MREVANGIEEVEMHFEELSNVKRRKEKHLVFMLTSVLVPLLYTIARLIPLWLVLSNIVSLWFYFNFY